MTYLFIGLGIGILIAVIAGIVAFKAGVTYNRKISEAEIGSAEDEAKRIVDEALKDAESKKKEPCLKQKRKFTGTDRILTGKSKKDGARFPDRKTGSTRRKQHSIRRPML